ncbi:MAG: hypothetical protein LKG36_05685 [[Lactobacillus] timonensis]|jgi:hypothetical protein|nr:hypothetical protein [[Lactobacillus] timonensis]
MDDKNNDTLSLIIKIVFWFAIAVLVYLVGMWIWHLAVNAYYWVKNLLDSLWDWWTTILSVGIVYFIYSLCGGSTIFDSLFSAPENPKQKYMNHGMADYSEPTYHERALGDDGYYHDITIDRYGARDEHGTSVTYHDHEFHK